MTKKMLIDATHAEETRVVVVDGNRVDEFDFESLNRRQLAGNIYLAKVTRVEPSLQAAFVEYGGNRHGFLAFSEIHPDYYQIPKADREALLAEEAELAREADEEAPAEKPKSRGRSRSRSRSKAAAEAAPAEAAIASDPLDDATGPVDAAADLDDVPPPSAASGEVEIDVPEEPAAVAEAPEHEEYEAVGGDDATDERASRPKPRHRRYKIQEVVKVRQILLVQVVKEERGNKGAALTTYLSLAGRYCVLMPNTARGGGISRKITNATDRKKLKEIASSITVPEGAGLIIRTAGSNRTKTEIKRDYEYLLRQWEQIRDLTLQSIAPKLIYEEGSLIKRVIRDLYSRDIDEILVDGERGYREAKDYMKMLMPSHAKNVKHYADALPLFSRFQVESYLSAMFNPTVQLKSGGYIVIDVTEALVAIDVNSGRATRESSIEETALRTNLEAAEEAARQMRLRDLAGLIVIDFIDMEERRNNAAVEKKLKDKLKFDRARIQVGRISGFGLLEMSRQRLRPGMIEATTKPCAHCHGTGRVRSDDSIALALLRELEEEGVRQRSKEVLIAAPVEIANYLLNQKREHIAMIEGRFGLSVRIEGDAALISPDYRVEKFKTASRIVQIQEGMAPVKVAYPEDDEVIDAEEVEEAEVVAPADAAEAGGEEKSGAKRKRRRRRRGGAGRSGNGEGHMSADAADGQPGDADDEEGADEEVSPDAHPAIEAGIEAAAEAVSAEPAAEPAREPAAEPEPQPVAEKPKSRRRTRRPKATEDAAAADAAVAERPSPLGEVIDAGDEQASEIVPVPEDAAPPPRRRERVRKSAAAPAPVAEPAVAAEPVEVAAEVDDTVETVAEPVAEPVVAYDPAEAEPVEAPVPAMAEADAGPAPTATQPAASEAPRRRGWWSRAISGS